MTRYPTFGMEKFEITIRDFVDALVESLGDHKKEISIKIEGSKDEVKILFNNPSGLEVVLIVKRDIDRVRFYVPVPPSYKSIDDIPRDLYDELIYVRSPSTPEIIKPDRWFGEWKVDYDSDKKFFYFCLVHDDLLTRLDEQFGPIFYGLWNECMWYHANYQKLSK